jgi:opacity protein-like surface antigen
MRYRLGALLVFSFCLVWSAPPSEAQWWSPTSWADRWEVTPYVGYETGGSFPINSSLTVDSLRVEPGVSFGAYVDYSLSENLQAEFMWGRTNTSFSAHDVTTNTFSKAFNSDIDQFQFGFLYMFRNSEQKLRPFAAGGIGFTHEFNDGIEPNHTNLSYGLGGGVKYSLAKHISLRGDIRWVPTRAGSTPAQTCDFFGNCFVVNQTNYLQRVNFTGGVTFHF